MTNLVPDPVSWTEDDRLGLDALLDVLLPPTAGGMKPSGSGVDFLVYAEREGLSAELWCGVRQFLQEYGVKDGQPFRQLAPPEQVAVVKIWERKQGVFFRTFIKHVMYCYYQDARVLTAIGVEPRPPFPDGFGVSDGDLTLLEPVFERGRLHR